MLHPGYASHEVLAHEVVTPLCDIYSFGMTFFVLIHNAFYKKEVCATPLDHVLEKCVESIPENRYQSFLEVKEAVRVLYEKKKKSVLKRSISCFIVSALCMVTGIYFMQLTHKEIESKYHTAMMKENYQEAIGWKPTEVGAYRKLYNQALLKSAKLSDTQQESAMRDVLLIMEEMMIKSNQKDNSEIAYFFSLVCLRLNDIEFYKKASESLSYVNQSNIHQNMMLEGYKEIAKTFSKQQQITKQDMHYLQSKLNQMEKEIAFLANPVEQYENYALLLSLYENRKSEFGKECNDIIISLANKLEKIKKEHKDIILNKSVFQTDYNSSLYVAYYDKGVEAIEHKDYQKMKINYDEAIRYYNVQKSEVDDVLLLAHMYIALSEYDVTSTTNTQHIKYLEEAKKACVYVKKNNEDNQSIEEMIRFIEEKLTFWRA
ncbi:MAG: hypothetical protein RR890_01165 [Longicatena sp.]